MWCSVSFESEKSSCVHSFPCSTTADLAFEYGADFFQLSRGGDVVFTFYIAQTSENENVRLLVKTRYKQIKTCFVLFSNSVIMFKTDVFVTTSEMSSAYSSFR